MSTSSENPIDALVGTALGRWTLEKRLGDGAMGPVFEAVSTGRTSGALHLVRPELVAGPEALERFRRDAKTFQKVEHPNVPRLLDVDEANGHVFLVFELVTGRSLQFRLDKKEPLSPSEARHLATDLLSSLAALHDRGVIHGDVKPASVLSGLEGYWRLTGFSLAPQESAGTPLFMAPERCEGLPPSVGSDLYSAGATIYAAIAGEPPFLRPSVAAILEAHVNDAPPDLATRAPTAEKDVVSLVTVLMAKSPARRPPDARTALAVLTKKDRPRSKTQMLSLGALTGEAAAATAATLPPAGAALAPAPETPPAPPGTKTTRRMAHDFVAEEEKRTAREEGRVPWLRALLPLAAGALIAAAAWYAPGHTPAQRVVLGGVSAAVFLAGLAWVLAGTIPSGLSHHAVARTLLERVPLRLSVFWNRRRSPVLAAMALGQLGDLGAGEILLDAGEPRLAAEEFVRAGVPLAAAIVFEKLDEPVQAIDSYIAAGKLDEAARVARSSGKNEEAGEAFEKAGHIDKAIQSYTRAERPLRLAAIYEQKEKWLEAAQQYELATETQKAAELYERAGQTADCARLYHRLGDLARVSAVWEKAGDAVNAARWRAEAELAEGRRANAARAFEKAGMHDRASDLFLAQGLLPDAIRCAEAHGDPSRLAPLCARAGDFSRAAALYEDAGEDREAAQCFHELGDRVKEATALERAGEEIAAADVWLAADRVPEAERVLNAIPRSSSDRKRALTRLGELHARSGRMREAALALDEALEGETPSAENVTTFVECADALAASGELDRAIERLSQLRDKAFAPPTLKIRLAELEKKRRPGSGPVGAAGKGGKDLVGFELDRYRTVAYTGDGELSWGYEAEHTLLKRAADLRVLKSSLDEESVEQFFAEGRALAIACHPNLPDVYDSGRTASGLSYIAVEVARDPTLRQLLRQAQGALPIPRAAMIASGILAGLSAAHAAGIVHGDLKPENVLVAASDQARIVRFAFARQAPPSASASQTLGFVARGVYSAPEQLAGSAPAPASDQYACGVMLYEMLAGFQPFGAVMDPAARAAAKPLALTEVSPGVPPALAAAIMKAMEADSMQRHKSVAMFHALVTKFAS